MPFDDIDERYLQRVSQALQATLGEHLVGVYLHGSAALGDFQPTGVDESDLDVIAVCERALSDAETRAVASVLSHEALPCPALGLEFHVVTRASAATPSKRPAFELHMATGRTQHRIVDGRGHPGDTDLVMHYAVCREHGRALFGPPPVEIFALVPRAWLLEAFVGELRWARDHAPAVYQVLNACRAWRYAEAGVLCSKTEGGTWARMRGGDSGPVIDAALRVRRDGSTEPLDEQQVEALLARVEAILEGAA